MHSSELSSTPGVIPYVEPHDGPRRLLTIEPVPSGMLAPEACCPVIGIDGRQYYVIWGPTTFEIPADRNVHVGAHLAAESQSGFASALLPPGSDPLSLQYAARGWTSWQLRQA
jgi:hypothetical protein